MDIFLEASRQKIRFDTNKGAFGTEVLWDIPLTSKTGFDLDTIAKGVKHALDAANEESFVKVSSPANAVLQLKLDVIKQVIAVRLEEREKASKAQARASERKLLMEILAGKEQEQLAQLTPEQIKARLAELDK